MSAAMAIALLLPILAFAGLIGVGILKYIEGID